MLLCQDSRDFVGEVIKDVRVQFEDTIADGALQGPISKIRLMNGVKHATNSWNWGVWGAVRKRVGIRLPHELQYRDRRYANCGECALVLYGAAHELGFDNVRFVLYRSYDHADVFHACILFDHEGDTYIADPSDEVTRDFKIKSRKIVIDGEDIPHYGLKYLSDDDLKRYIEELRGEDHIIRLFGGGQFLIQDRDYEGPHEIFVWFNENGRPENFPNYKGPTLEVILGRTEPYNENTGVRLFYSLDGDQPLCAEFYDISGFKWGLIDGVSLGHVINPGTSLETRVFRDVVDLVDDETIRVIAYLDYMKAVEKKAREKGLHPRRVYLKPKRERDILRRLEREKDALLASGREDEAKKKLEAMELYEGVLIDDGRYSYERYCDFRLAFMWDYDKRGDKVLEPYKEKGLDWGRKTMAEYVGRKHLVRMRELLDKHGKKIQTVRERVAVAL